jgi:hypothetical protein
MNVGVKNELKSAPPPGLSSFSRIDVGASDRQGWAASCWPRGRVPAYGVAARKKVLRDVGQEAQHYPRRREQVARRWHR